MSFSLQIIIELAKRDFLERYAGSILGFGWAFILPVINILIYTLIFSHIMIEKLPALNKTPVNYGLYIASGLLPWTAFSNTVLRVSTVFTEKRNFITKTPISLISYPLSIVISEGITFLIGMLFFLLILIVFIEIDFSLRILLIPVSFLVLQSLALSIGLMAAVLNVFFRDIKEIISVAIQLWFWLTPIVYTVYILPSKVQQLMILNPAYNLISVFQNILIFNSDLNPVPFIVTVLASAIILIMAIKLIHSLDKELRDAL